MKITLFALLLAWAFVPGQAQATTSLFNLPRFVNPDSFAVGIEPVLTLSDRAGLAANARYTQGVSDFFNLNALVGTGGNPRGFRIGGGVVFDAFPDTEGQPGIGVATQGVYYRLTTKGQFEFTFAPYVHKTFVSADNEFDPFISVPFGWGFNSDTTLSLVNVAVGSMFKATENVKWVLEIGIKLKNTESYISGGIVYHP